MIVRFSNYVDGVLVDSGFYEIPDDEVFVACRQAQVDCGVVYE